MLLKKLEQTPAKNRWNLAYIEHFVKPYIPIKRGVAFLEKFNIVLTKVNILFMNHKKTEKFTVKNLINQFFMQSPVPMSITKAKDGTYVWVNEALLSLWMKRKDILD